MLPALTLLNDTLTFLAFLHSHDTRPMGRRWLSPTALRALNPQLLVHDRLAVVTRGRGGRRGTSERETERIRFIHFLCEAARLVARTGSYLKPTLRVQRWLAAEPFDQLQQLFNAAFPDRPSREHDELWRTYRLPGWSLSSPTLEVIHPVLHLLRAAPSDEQIKLTTLLKLIPPLAAPLPEDGDEAPADIVRGLLECWHTLGLVEWHGTVISMTELGANLIAPTTARSLLTVYTAAVVQIDHQRYTLLDVDPSTLYELSDYAELIAVKPRRRYRLDRSLIQRALQRGQSLDALLRFLENAIGDALPDRLAAPLRDWAAQLDRVSIRRVTLLEVKDPATLTDLTRSHRVRESIQRTLSPRAVVVRDSRLPALLRQLARRGLTPRTNLPARLPDHPTTRLFDHPSVAQLYFTALLNQHLADRLPAPYRVDYSLVLELQTQLSAHDQQVAEALAQEAATLLAEHRPPTTAETWPVNSSSATPSLSSIVTLIEQAIANHTPLAITYYSPTYDQTTQRIIEPLRLEWRGDVPYLIAWCRLRQDERVFRVERIADISAK